MSVIIPQEFQQFVRQEVASGKYRSEQEVLSAGLRLLQEQERKREALLEDIEIGLVQLAEGAGITIADEKEHQDFFRDIEIRGQERLAAKRAKE